jgi:hypothetical protein
MLLLLPKQNEKDPRSGFDTLFTNSILAFYLGLKGFSPMSPDVSTVHHEQTPSLLKEAHNDQNFATAMIRTSQRCSEVECCNVVSMLGGKPRKNRNSSQQSLGMSTFLCPSAISIEWKDMRAKIYSSDEKYV